MVLSNVEGLMALSIVEGITPSTPFGEGLSISFKSSGLWDVPVRSGSGPYIKYEIIFM